MTKTKVSTIAIVVLSVLLAAALAATIVLAAFSFTRSATTTLTFGSGVSIEVTGITSNSWNAKAIDSQGNIGEAPTSLTNLTTGVTLENITVTNSTDTAVRVAVAVVISGANNPTLYTDVSTMSKDIQLTGNAWKGATAEAASFQATPQGASELTFESFKLAGNAGPVTIVNYIHTVFAAADIAALTGGESFTATVYIAAVFEAGDDAATVAALQSAIAANGAFSAGA